MFIAVFKNVDNLLCRSFLQIEHNKHNKHNKNTTKTPRTHTEHIQKMKQTRIRPFQVDYMFNVTFEVLQTGGGTISDWLKYKQYSKFEQLHDLYPIKFAK